jgi:hypothetical protein
LGQAALDRNLQHLRGANLLGRLVHMSRSVLRLDEARRGPETGGQNTGHKNWKPADTRLHDRTPLYRPRSWPLIIHPSLSKRKQARITGPV